MGYFSPKRSSIAFDERQLLLYGIESRTRRDCTAIDP